MFIIATSKLLKLNIIKIFRYDSILYELQARQIYIMNFLEKMQTEVLTAPAQTFARVKNIAEFLL